MYVGVLKSQTSTTTNTSLKGEIMKKAQSTKERVYKGGWPEDELGQMLIDGIPIIVRSKTQIDRLDWRITMIKEGKIRPTDIANGVVARVTAYRPESTFNHPITGISCEGRCDTSQGTYDI